MRLKDKNVLITGATKGIGAVMAQRFAQQGARVVLTGRTQAAGEALAAQIRAEGDEARFVAMDVADETSVREAVKQAVEWLGGLHVLVNNAGPTDLLFAGRDKPIHRMSTEDFDAVLKVGLFGPFWCCKYAMPALMASGTGSIVNISSMAAVAGLRSTPGYTSAKAGLAGLTRQIAVDYADAKVRANVIICGLIIHESTEALVADPEMAAAFLKLQLTRLGKPDDVASAAIYLASDDSSFVTGSTMTVDGGTLIKASQPTDAMFETIHAGGE